MISERLYDKLQHFNREAWESFAGSPELHKELDNIIKILVGIKERSLTRRGLLGASKKNSRQLKFALVRLHKVLNLLELTIQKEVFKKGHSDVIA